jgi:hypothetical protein
MAAQGRRRTLIPSKLQKNRTLVIVIIIAVIALFAVVAALALGTNLFYGGGNQAPPSQPTYRSGQNTDLRVDSVSVDQNIANSTTAFNVTVTNTGNAQVEGNLSVQVYSGPQPPAPNQPYPNRGPSVRDPNPSSGSSPVTSTIQPITLAAGETKAVPVFLTTPPGLTVDPSNVVITLS